MYISTFFKKGLVSLFILISFSLHAQYPNLNDYHTGGDGLGGVLPHEALDLNWTVAEGTASSIPPNSSFTPATVITLAPSCVPGNWYDPITDPVNGNVFTNSAWISYDYGNSCPNNHGGSDSEVYFKTSFDLPATGPCGGDISDNYCFVMDYLADNILLRVYVNGIMKYDNTGSNQSEGFKYANRAQLELCDGWLDGSNEIMVYISSEGGLSGFLAQARIPELPTGSAATPICIAIDTLDLILQAPDYIVNITAADIDLGSYSQCNGVDMQIDTSSFDCDDIGLNEVILTVFDEQEPSLYMSQCTTIVRILDEESPQIICPQDLVLECDGDYNTEISVWLSIVSAADGCSNTIIENDYVSGTTPSISCDLSTGLTVTFTATDESGNTTTCSANIFINDSTIPQLDIAAADMTVECDGTSDPSGAFATWLSDNGGASATDVCGTVSWSNNSMGLSDECGATGRETVTFTATDECGNESTTQATFTIEDTTEPEWILAPTNMTIECDDTSDPSGAFVAWLISFIGTDVCGNVALTNNSMGLSDECGATGSETLTFTLTDECGNFITADATFTIEDTTPPEIDPMAMDMTVECDGTSDPSGVFTAWLADNGGASATDVCGDVIWTNNSMGLSDDCGATGSETVTFTATDECGNTSTTQATFTIEDTTSPTIDCLPSITVSANPTTCEADVILVTPNIIDNCSTSSITWTATNGTSGIGDASGNFPVGVTTISYTATDECGNTSYCDQDIIVISDAMASLACLGTTNISLDQNGIAIISASLLTIIEDDCGITTTIEGVRMDGNICIDSSELDYSPDLIFCCQDVGSTIQVMIKVTDVYDNEVTCIVDIVVEDKIGPFLNCPSDINLECNDPNLDLSDLSNFGQPVAIDNCDGNIAINELVTESINQCGEGVIIRTFIATDNFGNSSECTQVITLSSTDTFDESDIVWPTEISVESCGIYDLNPDNLAAGADYPQINDVPCHLIGYSYYDEIFDLPYGNGICTKIVRTWTVIDWCQRDANGNYFTITHQQTIQITNSINPVLVSNCDNLAVCISPNKTPDIQNRNSDISCESTYVELIQYAADDCTEDQNLTWSVSFDYNTDGSIDIIASGTGNNFNASQQLPLGTHTVEWTVFDDCGNSTSCTQTISIANCIPPSIYCKDTLCVFLQGTDPTLDGQFDNELVTLTPSDLLDSFYHACDYPFTLSFSQDTTDTELIFNCNDLLSEITGGAGTYDVNVFATDINGNQTFCTTSVEVKDTNAVYICQDPDFDLALVMSPNNSAYNPPYMPGDFVSFYITVYNQGNVHADNIVVENYVPNGLNFDASLNSDFTDLSGNIISSIYSLSPNSFIQLSITFQISSSYVGNHIINNAEIISADNHLNLADGDSDLAITNENGTPETSTNNDISDSPDNNLDEDDYDPEIIMVNCDTAPTCSVNDITISLDSNGQYNLSPSEINARSQSACGNISSIMVTPNVFSCNDLGAQSVSMIVTDEYGNSSQCTSSVTVIDANTPLIFCTDTIILCSTAVNQFPAPVISSTCNDATLVLVDEQILASNPCNVKYQRTYKAIGLNGIESNECIQNITLIDTTAPVFTASPSNITIECNNPTIIPAISATDDCSPFVNFDVAIFDSVGTPLDYISNFDAINGQAYPFPIGNSSLQYIAIDQCGNSSVYNLSIFNPEDTTPPVCNTKDITVYLDSLGQACINPTDIEGIPSCTPSPVCINGVSLSLLPEDTNGDGGIDDALVTLNAQDLDAGSYSSCGNPITVSFSPDIVDTTLLFECSNLGLNAVELWVTDINTGSQNFCYTTVDIQDNQAICPQSLSTSNNPQNSSSSIIFQGFTDNCGLDTVTLSQDKFYCNDILTPQQVIVTVTDYSGNTSTCVSTVTVLDTLAPICPVGLDITVQLEAGQCDSNVFFDLPTVTDNCDPNPVSSPIIGQAASGDSFSIGTHTIQYQAEDSSGNTAICSFDLTIEAYPTNAISCNGLINLSLDPITCNGRLSTGMLLSSIENIGCPDSCTITVKNEFGDIIPNDFGFDDVGNIYSYEICCGGVCCWGEVRIESKGKPIIECTPIEVMACSFDNVDLSTIPYPTVTGYCGTVEFQIVNQVIEMNDACDPTDLVGTITRSFIAEDSFGNQSEPCDQVITVKRIDTGEIIFPANYSSTECNGSIDPSVTGVPQIHNSLVYLLDIYPIENTQLCNLMVSYEDHPIGEDNCHKQILRMWTVAEWWCGGITTPIQYGQIIEINDLTPPSITCTTDMTVSTDGGYGNCEATFTLPAATVSDDCNSPVEVNIIGGPEVLFSNGGEITLPTGKTILSYVAYDGCYNSSSCQVEVTVEDVTRPTVLCDQNTAVSITAGGTQEVLAEAFDDGSFDDCALDRFEVRRMDTTCDVDGDLFGPTVRFCCLDVGNDSLMVVLRAYDISGNYNDCMVNVEVQDKDPATLTCPPNQIIVCTTPYDLNNLSTQFGSASVTDNCADQPITETVTSNINNCGLGNIRRTFSINDGVNGTVSCTQVITVRNPNPFDGDDSVDLIWPADYSTTSMCDLTDAHPDMLPAGFGYPAISEDACDLVGVDFEDQDFSFANDTSACFKILRTWTVIDWCQRRADGTYLTWSHIQEIKINNEIAPTIPNNQPGLDALVESLSVSPNGDCLGATANLVLSATDDCINNTPLNYIYTIYKWEEATMSHSEWISSGTSNDATAEYAVGLYRVNWIVFDGCGNEASYTHQFEVVNNKPPVAICLDGLSTALTLMDTVGDNIGDTNMVEIWASDIDYGSYHSCYPQSSLTLAISSEVSTTPNVFSTNLAFTTAGMNIPVSLMVTDQNGNTSICHSHLSIEDNEPRAFVDIQGEIKTEDAERISTVEVSMLGAGEEDMTQDLGEYAFADMPVGGDYTIDPSKNTDVMNGVSTLDLVLIQKHILQTQLLDSPYKHIAADINHDERISALDLIQLRKLILGIYEEFPDNESWRFVDGLYSFPEGIDPLELSFPEDYSIQDLNTNMWIDFVGVKIGDVNGSVIANTNEEISETRSNEILELSYLESVKQSTEEITISFTGKNFTDIAGLQFALEHKGLELQRIESGILNINESNIGIVNTDISKLSWNSDKDELISASTDDILFSLVFKTSELRKYYSSLSLNKIALTSEAYRGNQLETVSVILNNSVKEVEHGLAIHLYQNEPNPWSNTTSITVSASQASNAQLIIQDVLGKTVLVKDISLNKGENILQLSNADIPISGIYNYSIFQNGTLISKQMIKI